MNAYLEILNSLAEFSELCDALKSKITPLSVLGVSDSVRAHLAFCVCEKLNKGCLFVASTESSAREVYKDMSFFVGETNVLLFNSTELMFHDAEAESHEVLASRLNVLNKLISSRENLFIITSPEALLSVTVPKNIWDSSAIRLEVGNDMELDTFINNLISLGYKREDMVEGAGQFSVRGGIVDIFPCTSEYPYRIEFFDTEVDSIRIFAPDTQRTIERAEIFEASPATEILLNDKDIENLISNLTDIAKNTETATEQGSRLHSVIKRDIERLQNRIYFPSIDKYIPYIYPKDKPTLLDYLPGDYIIFMEEPSRISERLEIIGQERANTITELYEFGIMPSVSTEFSLSYHTAIKRMQAYDLVTVSGLSHNQRDIKPKRTFSINSRSITGFNGNPELMLETLEHYRQNLYRTIILAGTPERAANLAKRFEDDGIKCSYQTSLTSLPNNGGIVVCGGSVGKGFEYPLIQIAVIGDREIFGNVRKKKKRPLYRGKMGDKISDFTTLTPGDYVVHRNHGIGMYSGITQLNVDGVRKDYLTLTYKGSDTLYVPTDQLDMVYRYDKKDGARVKLNSLGGTDWEKTRRKVKEAAAEMAKKLIALYAERANRPGISFSADTEWQKDFEAAFPYEETDDQLRSIDEVKADMEKPHPMDRLLCGDVGYGKTEVALRAAFKAVMSGYQVAYLVPTTILANQHYNTFKQRMMDYPVNIRMLSRFVTPAAQKEIIKNLASGETDIVIGTHKLLSDKIKFNNLGLLIIDEEQRFGVTHKEKIKEMRSDIDVLTLSATPIPRTLHMSLSGIRDMSIINQPPSDRHPVQTYVLEYDEFIIREAIERELTRGGQVYYLFNRVDGIYKTANRIAELVPQARIAVVHGKMREAELEQVMMEVSEGEIDVLVCTTIIETGLDIANVNTIIIENSDRLGLSQMYQLRGRVGRSNRLAYAYLTFRRNKMLSEEAEKRLLAMKEFTEFGSGFKIAMRDLEIRGTGNLIGAEQHGHMESVGYEMYCRLLEEAVREEKGDIQNVTTETSVDLPVSAFIPESYINDHSRRIGAYKKIAAIYDTESLYDVYDEIEDRYGTIPQSVSNLMYVALIKNKASSLGISEMTGNDTQILMSFDKNNLPDMQNAVNIMTENPKELFMTNPDNPKLHFKIAKPNTANEQKYLDKIVDLLNKL